MTPQELVGKRVVAVNGRRGPCRVLGFVEDSVLALEAEDREYQGTYCTYKGKTYVPSGRGSWVRSYDVTVIPEESGFIIELRSYLEKELGSCK